MIIYATYFGLYLGRPQASQYKVHTKEDNKDLRLWRVGCRKWRTLCLAVFLTPSCPVLQVAAQTQQPGRGWTDPSQPVHWSATLRTHPTRPRLLWACSHKCKYSGDVMTSFSAQGQKNIPHAGRHMRDYRLSPRSRRDLRSSGKLCSVKLYFLNDVSGQNIRPISRVRNHERPVNYYLFTYLLTY